MDIEDVFERFALMADLSAEEAEKYKPLCMDAAAEIERNAKTNDKKAQGILCAAAAALCLYRWALVSASSMCESFSAGDIRVTKSRENISAAKEIWIELKTAAAPYLNDDGFIFEGI